MIASHCDKAQWLYPTPAPQQPPNNRSGATRSTREVEDDEDEDDGPVDRKRLRLNGTQTNTTNGRLPATSYSDKYRPFHLIEEELIRNLKNLMTSTTPESIQGKTSTMIAGALTLALSYINRRSQDYQESLTGISTNLADQSAVTATDPSNNPTNSLQSRILIITLSPSTDLAHQYIPIMNSIFACQRLNIPIDVLHLAIPHDPSSSQSQTHPQQNQTDTNGTTTAPSPTVFLQQATDATHGIFIAARLTPPNSQSFTDSQPITSIAQQSLLTYLLTALLPTPQTRATLIPPTLVDVDFRAACFCHRNVISTGYVCSICLSIFCDLSLPTLSTEGCLTCGSFLGVRGDGIGGWTGGKRPVVVAAKKKKKKKGRIDGAGGESSRVGTPTPGLI